MIIVSDVIGQVGRVLGTCDPDYTYDVLTRAVELLANKPTKTNVVWDPLICYVDIPVVDRYYVCLPPHILKPINKLHVINSDQSTTLVDAFIGEPYTQKISGILEASKPTTKGTISVYANQFVLDSSLVARWDPEVHYPQFEWIK